MNSYAAWAPFSGNASMSEPMGSVRVRPEVSPEGIGCGVGIDLDH
jgi:hypothetical protein